MLDGRAQAAGVSIVTGLGWTPGLTNLLARLAYERLDSTRAIDIAWAGSSADSSGLAVVLHTMHAFTGQVPAYVDGRWTTVPAGSGRRRLNFGPPVGEVWVCYVGHPEPVTIPRHLPGLQSVTLRGGLTEAFLHWLAVAVARAGLTATDRRKATLAGLITPLLPWLERVGPPGVAASGLRVDAAGERGGAAARLRFAATGHMADLTARPLALGAVWLGAGRVERTGVFAPEADGAIPPGPFLQELEAAGIRIREEVRPGLEGD